MGKLFRATIWARGAIPVAEWKYRSLKRVWLPIVDLLFILGGLSAVRFGVPAINEFFPDAIVDLWGRSLSLTATICLVGVAFVRLWWLEAAAKCVLLGLMLMYIVALLTLTRAGEDSRGFVFVIATIAIIILLVRLSIIGSEWAERRARKAPGIAGAGA